MDTKKDLFKHGPLYNERHEIADMINPLIKTGDIFLRLGNESIFGIPFSRLVAKITHSDWSHGSVAILEDGIPYLLEVNDRGTQKYIFIDWLDFCTSGEFAILRLKDLDTYKEKALGKSITDFFNEDPDYDFTFDEPNKYYCTESVAVVYENAGIKLVEPKLVKDLIPWHAMLIGTPINFLIKIIAGRGLNLSIPIYVIGNEKEGIMSSDKLYMVKKVSFKELYN